MSWEKRFHDDHMALISILPKIEGNIKNLEHGDAGINTIWELKEFASLINDVIIPHFREEEKSVYPKVAAVDEEGREFINEMLQEHQKLCNAFAGFTKCLEESEDRIIGSKPDMLDKKKIGRMIVHSRKYNKGDNSVFQSMPKNIDKEISLETLAGGIDREKTVHYGNIIVAMLKEHIEKEETMVAELLKRADNP